MDGAADGFFAEALAVYYHRLRPADFFGDQGYRFLMGISGLVIILCGLVFLFLS